MRRCENIIGNKYGRLTVLEKTSNKKHNHYIYVCRCDCGNYTEATSDTLKKGSKKSCGCLGKSVRFTSESKAHTIHGLHDTRLYRTWKGMKSRCYNNNDKFYSDYGGRGITICDDWKNNFESFYRWAMMNGYDDSLTIDRIDVNGNYEPFNCRWSTMLAQNNNRRSNHKITIEGETKTVVQWCRDCGISKSTFYQRLNNGKTGLELIAPPRKSKGVR